MSVEGCTSLWFLPEHEKLFPKRNGNTASVRPTVRQPSAVVLHESVLRERGRCSDCGSAAVRPSTTVTRERTRPLLLALVARPARDWLVTCATLQVAKRRPPDGSFLICIMLPSLGIHNMETAFIHVFRPGTGSSGCCNGIDACDAALGAPYQSNVT